MRHSMPPGIDGQRADLCALFAASVARHGAGPAVTGPDGTWTYTELDRWSDDIAGMLAGHGVHDGDRVAFHLERGPAIVAVLLGILKAGAAYVPIEWSFPQARRDEMTELSRSVALVTGGAELRVQQIRTAEPASWPEPPACVMFTSGSAGRPKPVVLTHQNLIHFATNPGLPPLTPADRVGHASSISFDASHYEIWCTLAAGAEIVILPSVASLVQSDVNRELKRHRITAMLLPTMAVNHIVRADREALAGLRILLTGGDVLQPSIARELLSSDFTGTFYNLYGPTEATTACTAYPVTEVTAGDVTVPIGRPLPGCSAAVLNPQGVEVADGEVGLLHVGGPGVAWGYLDGDRFPLDPVAADGRPRYNTGDLVRRRSDGVLEFLGRADDQVKIRGYRVEPGEVEGVLCQHPQIRDAAVVACGTADSRHLVALVVAYGKLNPSALRKFAAALLPDHLLPSSFRQVSELPADGNGKRDRGRLRELANEQWRRTSNRVAPRTETEHYVAGLWEELLAVEGVGIDDDFFALGGNSLLALSLRRRVSRDLGVDLQALDVLATTRLSNLAALIGDRLAGTPS
ncbi:non-ribosomal peptide synthetase [Micromonospora sp. DT53]|uniref:non-ribosomal peptide synthetase n=1 Tax=Micromonospora sp. DT53 TaxID=3393444 RepID=UPI003CE85F88